MGHCRAVSVADALCRRQLILVACCPGGTASNVVSYIARADVPALVLPVAPLVAVMMIVLIVASIIGAGRTEILESGFGLAGAVCLLHTCGFVIGYGLARATSGDMRIARTVSIEVGMQNSGLGAVLARQNCASPLVAIPSAISSLFHSLIASALAGYWRRVESRGPGE